MNRPIVVLGGGLAGLAAATALAARGKAVLVLEAKGRLGGRAGSFQDPKTGQLIDICQHVSMGCCTNFAHWCQTVGIGHYLEPQPALYFMTPDGKVSRFVSDRVPAPMHLARSFLRAHYLGPIEKLRVTYGLGCLALSRGKADPPFSEWLAANLQTQRTINRFWAVVLTSALNESWDRIGLRYARKVFVDGFLRHRRGFEVELPRVPLGRLYGAELLDWLRKHEVEVRLNSAVQAIEVLNDHIVGVRMRDGSGIDVEQLISAVPFDRVRDLLPHEVLATGAPWDSLTALESSPITSVHLWLDRPVTALPHIVLIDCVGQWIFNRGESTEGQHYLQIVVSASRQLRGMGHEEVGRHIIEELRRILPDAQQAQILHSRVITEHHATFSVVPGVDDLRPFTETPIENLFLAGDWTNTGWPATMEGAVRSGYLAAEALLEGMGQSFRIVRPDLR